MRLTSSFSVAASITMSQVGEIVIGEGGLDPVERRLALGFGDRLLATTWRAMLPLIVARPALILSSREVVQAHVEPRKGADMGDAAAHLAGADHADGLDLDTHSPVAPKVPFS